MEKIYQQYKKIKLKKEFLNIEAKDYIKENSSEAKKRANELSKIHFRLIKFLRSLELGELKFIANQENIQELDCKNKIISKLMKIFAH